MTVGLAEKKSLIFMLRAARWRVPVYTEEEEAETGLWVASRDPFFSHRGSTFLCDSDSSTSMQ